MTPQRLLETTDLQHTVLALSDADIMFLCDTAERGSAFLKVPECVLKDGRAAALLTWSV
jgi:hypothetical protein